MPETVWTWERVEEAVENIVSQVRARALEIDEVYGLPRGGTIPAELVARRLGVPTALAPPLSYNGRLLIVDDVHDSGGTLQKYLEEKCLAAVLACKPGRRADAALADGRLIVGLPVAPGWIVFPWERFDRSERPERLDPPRR